MASAKVQLLSFDEWPADHHESAEVLIFGTAVADNVLQAARKLVEEDSPATPITVVPLGMPGEILWHGVPSSMATIAAQVRAECLVFVHPQLCPNRQRFHSVWEAIESRPPSSLKICDTVAADWADEDFPRLAPQSRVLEKTLAAQIDLQGDASPGGVAIKAGLAQMLDDLDESHHFAQSMEGVGRLHLGDYWHAIMHRREPDYFNAKYWFRRVGTHPVGAELKQPAAKILEQCTDPSAESWQRKLTTGGWNSMAFVDLCESVARNETGPLGLAARQIQWLEMLFLLRFCWQNRLER